jgi:ABC-type lipoprotein export system ATPase subunit
MTPTTESPVVEALGLYHIYRERGIETVALRGADLTLAAGSWTALTGPSGSGKSTLLQILAGLLTPTAGMVRLAGEDITKLTADERAVRRRRSIGYVLQRDNLHPLLDVAGNVALPSRLDGRSARAAKQRADALLAQVGLAGHGRQRGGQLSGGEAQRVAVAVALAADPRVVLADEPTGELDDGTAESVLDLLAAYRGDHDAAILTVTHNPAVAERADRRFVIRDGVVVDEH